MKKKYIFGGIGALVLIILVVTLGFSLASKDSIDYLRNQEVDNLSFENAKLSYKNGVSTFTVEVYNETDKDYDIESIDIKLKDKKGKVTTLVGKVEDGLKSSEGRLLTAEVKANVTKSVDLEYVVNK